MSLLLIVAMTFFPPPPVANARSIIVVITTAVKKALRAMDLAVQRLQNQTIKLQNIQKALENAMSKLKLKEIYEWGDKQRNLFAGYYEELWKVRSAIAYYQRVKDIVQSQVQLVNEYRSAIKVFTSIKGFSPLEISHMLEVYTGILEHSIRNIDQITFLIKSFSLQMSDAKRLEMIHQVDRDIQKNLNDLRAFTNQNVILGIQRIKDQTEIETIKGLYNIP